MSTAICEAINAELRARGYVVHEIPGWRTRGNGYTSAYEGGLVHHTATDFGMALDGNNIGKLLVDGRPGLKGPLCNYAGNVDGSFTIIAAHPANHAGASGGRSMGPLPVTSLFNRRVLGLEIVYPGTVPMKPAQYDSAVVWGYVLKGVVGGDDPECIRAHAETSITGKWDPGEAPGKTIDMATYRRAVKNWAPPSPTALGEDEAMYIRNQPAPDKPVRWALLTGKLIVGLAPGKETESAVEQAEAGRAAAQWVSNATWDECVRLRNVEADLLKAMERNNELLEQLLAK